MQTVISEKIFLVKNQLIDRVNKLEVFRLLCRVPTNLESLELSGNFVNL